MTIPKRLIFLLLAFLIITLVILHVGTTADIEHNFSAMLYESSSDDENCEWIHIGEISVTISGKVNRSLLKEDTFNGYVRVGERGYDDLRWSLEKMTPTLRRYQGSRWISDGVVDICSDELDKLAITLTEGDNRLILCDISLEEYQEYISKKFPQ